MSAFLARGRYIQGAASAFAPDYTLEGEGGVPEQGYQAYAPDSTDPQGGYAPQPFTQGGQAPGEGGIEQVLW